MMKWITRENAKVDRIACPWLIRPFIDPDAKFLFFPPSEVMQVAAREGAIPFDVNGAELGHVEPLGILATGLIGLGVSHSR
jgi:hypothetical protein